MKVNYLSKDIEDEDKIPENITIRTMQSDMARLKEISKRKPTETSKDLPNKMSEVSLKEKLNDFYPKKPLKKPSGEKIKKPSSFLSFHKKAAPPAQLPTEKSEKKSEAFQQRFSAKISFDDAEKNQNINITEKEEDAVEFSLQNQPLEKKKKDIATSNTAGSAAIGLEKKTKTKKKGKKIILIVVLIIILICLGLAFYNFFILQNENKKTIFPAEETEKSEEPKKEKLKSIIPKIPFISDFQKLVIPTIQPLILIEKKISFDISSIEEFDLIATLDSHIETLKEIPEISLIEIRDENKILDLEKLSQKINIEIPEEITDNLSKNNYALIFLNLENEHRLGLVAEVNDSDIEKIQKNARQWEATMIDDLELLFLKTEIGSPSAANFQENTYKGIKIRYMNFSEPNVTIDYAFANNKLILATSKKNIYKIIDILKK